MAPQMRGIAHGQRAVGQAVTAYNYPGDNLMIHAALNVAQSGDVLVLTNGGVPQGALWGDVAATFAREKGVAGIVADGPVRDVHALRDLGSQVWSTSISPAHPEKRGPGSVNIAVVCAGVLVSPGDIVAADDDGVLVIPVGLASRVVERARRRSDFETEVRARLRAGQSLFEILEMQRALDAAGVETVDAIWQDGQPS